MDPERWQQVRALFRLALERASHERATFLEQACAGDPLLYQQVQELLAADEQAEDFLETPAVELAGPWSLDDGTEPMIGRRIGPYRIVCEIGRGGMGVVYRAERDDGEVCQQVVIKLIKRGMAGFWRRQIERAKEKAQRSPVSPVNMAKLHAKLGETEEAFAWLERAYAERDIGLTFLKAEPDFDNLHADPRFADLLRRVGRPP